MEKPTKRMTLRELLTHSEKCTRELVEHIQSNVLTAMSDFRDLTRPVRRRSAYPTLLAVRNALQVLEEAVEEMMLLLDHLQEALQEIRHSARRELENRL
ncbi:MAG: hypothetical protein C4297_07950 [Gemmataceae bacterium]